MNLRDRAITLVIAVLGLLFLWNLLIFSPQSSALKRTNELILTQQAETTKLNEKRTAIQSLVQNNTINKLVAKYKALQTKMQSIETQLARHRRRYIDDRELVNMLHSLIAKISNVTIVEFYNMHGESASEPVTTTSATTVTTTTTTTPTPAPAAPLDNKIKYRLVLKGEYFPIMDFLSKIEKNDWQIYWDEMDYTVTKYPEAQVVIEFYTLRPAATDLPFTEGSS